MKATVNVFIKKSLIIDPEKVYSEYKDRLAEGISAEAVLSDYVTDYAYSKGIEVSYFESLPVKEFEEWYQNKLGMYLQKTKRN